jgi:hypothetical protein
MKSLPFLFLSICISTFCIAQNKTQNTCTANLTLDPVEETVEKIHYIFTGSDTTGLNVKVTKITVVEGRRELVKRRKDKNCQSPNPEDCYIEVLEDIPPVTMNLYTLAGPDKTSEYDTRKEKIKVLRQEGGQVSRPVVCAKNRSVKLISKVQSALIGLGYPLTTNGIFDQATQLSMTDFQRTNKLAHGDLSLETLAALKIK